MATHFFEVCMKSDNTPYRISVGNKALWAEPKIAFFASRNAGEKEMEKIRCWGRNQAKNGMCLVGAFHSDAEKALLSAALRHGGKAVWILGKSIPEVLSREESRALDENRLLIISCFHREHCKVSTSRYANHLSAMNANALVFAHISPQSTLYPFYRRQAEKRPQDVFRVK